MSDEPGFEYQSEFYPWHVTDMGKDLMLIDRISGMGLGEFRDSLDDFDLDTGPAPLLLTLLATSIRHRHPGWPVDRIVRMVEGMSLSEVEFVGLEEPVAPLAEPAVTPTGEPARSQNNGSSPSSTPPEPSSSPTSSETPRSSGSPGSPATTPESAFASSNRGTGL